MSNVAITGNAAGTGVFTVASPNSNVDRVLTLPDESGTVITTAGVPTSAMPAGSVLQVVSTTKSDTFSSTSTSYVDVTGLAATITPTFATSRIFVTVSMVAGSTPANVLCATRLVRNATPIAVGNAASGYAQATVGNQRPSLDTNSAFNQSINFLDSPVTTLAITYKIQMFAESGTFRVNATGSDGSGSGWSARSISSITLMEIAG